VSRWAKQVEAGGRRALKHPGRAGRKPRLTAGDLRRLELGFQRGPEALGHTTPLWTAERVAALIQQQCGVRYHPGHVGRILRRLGWSCQRPTGRAVERDEAAIRHWKKVRWPQLKKRRAPPATDPLPRRKWPERTPASLAHLGAGGETPVLQYHFNWNTEGPEVTTFLRHLLRHVQGSC
jgi:transposase